MLFVSLRLYTQLHATYFCNVGNVLCLGEVGEVEDAERLGCPPGVFSTVEIVIFSAAGAIGNCKLAM